jgi:hypothetical protein
MGNISQLDSLKASLQSALKAKASTTLVATAFLETALTVAVWGACPTCGSQQTHHPLGPQGKPWVCRDPWHAALKKLNSKRESK